MIYYYIIKYNIIRYYIILYIVYIYNIMCIYIILWVYICIYIYKSLFFPYDHYSLTIPGMYPSSMGMAIGSIGELSDKRTQLLLVSVPFSVRFQHRIHRFWKPHPSIDSLHIVPHEISKFSMVFPIFPGEFSRVFHSFLSFPGWFLHFSPAFDLSLGSLSPPQEAAARRQYVDRFMEDEEPVDPTTTADGTGFSTSMSVTWWGKHQKTMVNWGILGGFWGDLGGFWWILRDFWGFVVVFWVKLGCMSCFF